MPERLGDTIKEESDGNTGRKEHHEVTHVIKLGLLILLAKLDVSVTESQPKDEKGKGGIGSDCANKSTKKSRVSHVLVKTAKEQAFNATRSTYCRTK